MSVYVLATGTIARTPEARRSQNDDAFVGATLRVAETGDGAWWRVTAFSEAAQRELLRLDVGDAVAVQGAMRVERYEKDGEPRIGLAIRAERVFALRQHDRGAPPIKSAPFGHRAGDVDEPAPF